MSVVEKKNIPIEDIDDDLSEENDEETDEEEEDEEYDEEEMDEEQDDIGETITSFDKSRQKDYKVVLNQRNVPFSEIGNEKKVAVPKGERQTSPYLTKYERTLVLGFRKSHLSQGVQPLIDNYENLNVDQIARKELEQNKIDVIIRRIMPNNTYEDWSLSELDATIY